VDDGERQLDGYREASERPPFVDLVVGPGLESDNRRFGELLERLRWRAGLSRADAAAKLGLSAEYLRLIEVGKRTPALGQMRKFLDTYGADGGVEKVMPGGDRPDLIVFDPLHGDGGDPVIVEFTSRIREARRRALGGPPDEEDWQEDLDSQRWVYGSPSASRASELGVVVSLLTRANDGTLRKIRDMLEREVGYGADPQGDTNDE
jgi:transcriptional regulator with XRE-family HTH domain